VSNKIKIEKPASVSSLLSLGNYRKSYTQGFSKKLSIKKGSVKSSFCIDVAELKSPFTNHVGSSSPVKESKVEELDESSEDETSSESESSFPDEFRSLMKTYKDLDVA
jgi:hypothetical protein